MNNNFLMLMTSLFLLITPVIVGFLNMKIVEVVFRKSKILAKNIYVYASLIYLFLFVLSSIALISFYSWFLFSINPIFWLDISFQDLVEILIFTGPMVALFGISFLILLLKHLKQSNFLK